MNRPAYRLHSELRHNALYVLVTPPDLQEPVPLALAGLRPDYKARLRELVRGDEIPPRILAALLAGMPRFVIEELSLAGAVQDGGARGATA